MGWLYEWCHRVFSRFFWSKVILANANKNIFATFCFVEWKLDCYFREGVACNGAKIKLLRSIQMIHLTDLFVDLFTLTPSVDLQGPWLLSILPILSRNPEAANKYILELNNRNTRKMCESYYNKDTRMNPQ